MPGTPEKEEGHLKQRRLKIRIRTDKITDPEGSKTYGAYGSGTLS
jgi:hypothetical protein